MTDKSGIVDETASVRLKRGLKRSTTLSGAAAAVLLAAIAMPRVAHAQDACGAPSNGAVTCEPRDDQYPDGIYYGVNPAEPQDLTINLADGFQESSHGRDGLYVFDLNGGVVINGEGSRIQTDGDNAVGAFASAAVGDLTVHLGDVATGGADSSGILTSTVEGTTDISAASITTFGDRSEGVDAINGQGDINIDVGSIATFGSYSPAVSVTSYGGDISVHADAVETHGAVSSGIETVNFDADGATVIDAGTVLTTGDYSTGLYAAGVGDVSVSSDDIATYGFASDGLDAITVTGDATVDAGQVFTAGDYSAGVYARAVYGGSLNVHADAIETQGSHSYGAFVRNYYGAVDVDVGDITTTGSHAAGLVAYSAYGTATVTAGDVETSREYATGVFVGGGSGATLTVDHVHTSGFASTGVAVVAGSYYTTGDATATVGSVDTFGDSSMGITVSSGGGTATVNAGSVVTRGYYSDGINAGSLGGTVDIHADSIETFGDRSNGVYAVGYGGPMLRVEVGDVAIHGDDAAAMRTTSLAGESDLTITGHVETDGYFSQGIFSTGNLGDTVIDNQGTITTNGEYSDGIISNVRDGSALIDGGAIVTHGDRSTGIRVFAVGDNGKAISISADSITTTGDFADGITAENPDDGVIALGTAAAALAPAVEQPAGLNDIVINTGTVKVTGEGSNGIFANGVADVTVTAKDTSSRTSNAIQIIARDQASLTVTGATTSDEGQAVFVTGADAHVAIAKGGSISGAQGGLTVDAVGPYVPPPEDPYGPVFFAAADAGDGTATIDNAGTLKGGDGYALLVERGTAIVDNSGTIEGAVAFGDGDDRLTNSGAFVLTRDSDFGAGDDLFVNSGTVSFDKADAVRSITLAGLETFRNTGGMVDLRNGAVGDTLTLPGDYVGADGARVAFDLDPKGISDTLVIGGAATGSTAVMLNWSGEQATLLSKPVTLVKAGAGTAADAFTLDSAAVGFIQYGLTYNGTGNSFDLTAQAGVPVYRLAKVDEGAEAIWTQSADAWSAHMASLRDQQSATGSRLWGQAYGKVVSRDDGQSVSVPGSAAQTYRLDTRQDYFGGQIGYDLGGLGGASGGAFGVTGGYLSSNLNFPGSASSVRFDTMNLGAYAGLKAGPLFVNVLGQYDHFWANAHDRVLGWSGSFDGDAYGARAEIGARFGTDVFFAEPLASIAWQRVDLGSLKALGQTLDFDTDTALTGKAGGRIGTTVDIGQGSTMIAYVRGDYVHEFRDTGGVLFESGGLTQHVAGERLGDHGEAAVGVDIATAGPVSGFIEADGDFGGSVSGGGGRVGLRLKF